MEGPFPIGRGGTTIVGVGFRQWLWELEGPPIVLLSLLVLTKWFSRCGLGSFLGSLVRLFLQHDNYLLLTLAWWRVRISLLKLLLVYLVLLGEA